MPTPPMMPRVAASGWLLPCNIIEMVAQVSTDIPCAEGHAVEGRQTAGPRSIGGMGRQGSKTHHRVDNLREMIAAEG